MPFIDTRNVERLQLVCNLLTYAHEFCTKESNLVLLNEATGGCPEARRLIEALRQLQARLHQLLPLVGIDAAWRCRTETIEFVGIRTTTSDPHLPQKIIDSLHESLNLRILEGALTIKPNHPDGNPSTLAMHLACASVWLSDLLALVILQIARVEHREDGSLVLRPADANMAEALRKLWFGMAFEDASLLAASFAIERLSIAASDPKYRSDLQNAMLEALCIFPQHWRLPVDDGPAAKLMFSHLEPLLLILIHCIVAKKNPSKLTPFDSESAKQKDIEDLFSAVLAMQSNLSIVDRLFEIRNGQLELGTRTLAPGVIAIAEHLAELVLGKDWHGNETSHIQKTYIIDRLKRNSDIEVLDFELRQHDTDEPVDLDVDFFIRDKCHSQLYGVQLKHLETNSKGGLLHWASRFRKRDSGLGNLVRQLENLKYVARHDQRARERMLENGVLLEECGRIVPVGLHNLGMIDFWEVQNGVLLYDIHTFANVLSGRSGVVHGIASGKFYTDKLANSTLKRPSPHDPSAVLDAYVKDHNFEHISHFDIAKKCQRIMKLGEMTIVAEGLGV